MNFADVLEIIEDSIAHRVKRVLERLTMVLGKGLEQHLSHTVPQRAELGFLLGVQPISTNYRGQDAVAFVLQRCIGILLEILKSGVRRFQNGQIIYARANLRAFAGSARREVRSSFPARAKA